MAWPSYLHKKKIHSLDSKLDIHQIPLRKDIWQFWTILIWIPSTLHMSLVNSIKQHGTCTLTCRIIVQQILLIFPEKNTYTTLLGPTCLLILRWYSTYTFIQTYTIINFWEKFLPAHFSMIGSLLQRAFKNIFLELIPSKVFIS